VQDGPATQALRSYGPHTESPIRQQRNRASYDDNADTPNPRIGAIGKVLLGFDVGFALIALVYTEPELFVVLIVAFAVIAYVFSLLGR